MRENRQRICTVLRLSTKKKYFPVWNIVKTMKNFSIIILKVLNYGIFYGSKYFLMFHYY